MSFFQTRALALDKVAGDLQKSEKYLLPILCNTGYGEMKQKSS